MSERMGVASAARAAEEGDLEAVRRYLSQEKSRKHQDILSAAIRGRQYEVARFLVAEGWVIKDEHIVEAAAWAPSSIVGLLLDNGARIEARDGMGMTPFLAAMEKGRIENAKLLVERGADVHATSPLGGGAFHYAASSDSPAPLELCSELGLDLNGRNDQGGTALHVAAMLGNVHALRHLLRAGADPGVKDWVGDLPIDGAMTLISENPACFEALLSAMSEEEFAAWAHGRDSSGLPPVHRAVFGNALNALETLLRRGSAPDVPGPNGMTALWVACRENLPDFVTALLEAGADPFLGDQRGVRPIDVAGPDARRVIDAFVARRSAAAGT
jgi:ankyrin repeat protein